MNLQKRREELCTILLKKEENQKMKSDYPMDFEELVQKHLTRNVRRDFKFTISMKDEPIVCEDNVLKIFENDDRYKDILKYNSFTTKIEYNGVPLRDEDVFTELCYIQRMYAPTFSRVATSMVHGALVRFAHNNSYHPVKDWLETLVWDKVPRVDSWLHTVYHCQKNQYTQEVGAVWMKSLVKRILEPGCKADHVLILEGAQGVGKSTSLMIIGKGYHTETLLDPSNKDLLQLLQGHLVIEFSEGETMSKAEHQALKGFVSTQIDRYREPYGRSIREYPRGCIFAMTTNDEQYLKDRTGNRRYLPIKVKGMIDRDWLTANVDQLYAEARDRVGSGETWWEMDKGLAEKEQESRVETDSLMEKAVRWLYSKKVTDIQRKRFDEPGALEGVQLRDFMNEVLFNGLATTEATRRDEMRCSAILKNDLCMRQERVHVDGFMCRRYFVTEKTPKMIQDKVESNVLDVWEN